MPRAWILDGLPRATIQAEALDSLLADTNQRINAAIDLEVDAAAMVPRISGPHTCTCCGEGYRDSFKKPPKDGKCDKCGHTEFKRRADDNAETVASRLDAYRKQTAPLVPYYQTKGVLKSVDAMGAIDAIAGDLAEIVQGATR